MMRIPFIENSSPQKLTKIAWIIIVLGFIVFASFYYYLHLEERALLKNGTREEVMVVQKYKTGTRKSPHYYMDVDWFTIVDTIAYYKSKDTTNMSNADKMSNDILSKVFKDKGRVRKERLYKTIRLKFINGDTYDHVGIGSIVTLVYERDHPENGRLLRELE